LLGAPVPGLTRYELTALPLATMRKLPLLASIPPIANGEPESNVSVPSGFSR
jgi:hypothetical protein